jgi:transposase-like protein
MHHTARGRRGARARAAPVREPFWASFLKGLVKRGLKGVRLVVSDAHDGLRHAIARERGAT